MPARIENGVTIHSHERIDDLQCKGRRLIQDPARFCFGIDAVLLAGFASVRKGEKMLDLGTGTGIIPILLEAKTEGAAFYGLELQQESAEMAERSVRLNSVAGKITIITGDIKSSGQLFQRSYFDVVTSNPPYINCGGGLLNEDMPRAISRHELRCTLYDVCHAAGQLLRPAGRFYMVHRPQRLVDILYTLRQCNLEPKTLRFVQPKADKPPNLVLIESVRGGGPQLNVLPPLIIYDSNGGYTPETLEIYYGNR